MFGSQQPTLLLHDEIDATLDLVSPRSDSMCTFSQYQSEVLRTLSSEPTMLVLYYYVTQSWIRGVQEPECCKAVTLYSDPRLRSDRPQKRGNRQKAKANQRLHDAATEESTSDRKAKNMAVLGFEPRLPASSPSRRVARSSVARRRSPDQASAITSVLN